MSTGKARATLVPPRYAGDLSRAEGEPMKVREIMTTPVVSVRTDTATADIAELLTGRRISGAPVVDDAGNVVGLVSEFDLMSRAGQTAADVMTPGIISVTEDTDVDDVRHLLVDRRIGRVPVVAGGTLVGIVSRGDIVKLLALEWVCSVCGEPVRGERPNTCPKCGADGTVFVQQLQPPGV